MICSLIASLKVMSAPDAVVAAAAGQQQQQHTPLTLNGAIMLFQSPRIPLILQIESIQRYIPTTKLLEVAGVAQMPSEAFDLVLHDGKLRVKAFLHPSLNFLVTTSRIRAFDTIKINLETDSIAPEGPSTGVRAFVDESMAGGVRICVIHGPIERVRRGNRLLHAPMRPLIAIDDATDSQRPLTGDRAYYTAPLTDDYVQYQPSDITDTSIPTVAQLPAGMVDLQSFLVPRGQVAPNVRGSAGPTFILVRVKHVSRVIDFAKRTDAPSSSGGSAMFGQSRYPCKLELLVEDRSRAVRAVMWNRLALKWSPVIRTGDVLLLRGARSKVYMGEFELSLNVEVRFEAVTKLDVDKLDTQARSEMNRLLPPASPFLCVSLATLSALMAPNQSVDSETLNLRSKPVDLCGAITFVSEPFVQLTTDRNALESSTFFNMADAQVNRNNANGGQSHIVEGGEQRYLTYRWIRLCDTSSQESLVLKLFVSSAPQGVVDGLRIGQALLVSQCTLHSSNMKPAASAADAVGGAENISSFLAVSTSFSQVLPESELIKLVLAKSPVLTAHAVETIQWVQERLSAQANDASISAAVAGLSLMRTASLKHCSSYRSHIQSLPLVPLKELQSSILSRMRVGQSVEFLTQGYLRAVQTASPFAFASIKSDVVRSAGLLATTGGEPIPLSSFFSVLPGMPMPNEAEAAKLISGSSTICHLTLEDLNHASVLSHCALQLRPQVIADVPLQTILAGAEKQPLVVAAFVRMIAHSAIDQARVPWLQVAQIFSKWQQQHHDRLAQDLLQAPVQSIKKRGKSAAAAAEPPVAPPADVLVNQSLDLQTLSQCRFMFVMQAVCLGSTEFGTTDFEISCTAVHSLDAHAPETALPVAPVVPVVPVAPVAEKAAEPKDAAAKPVAQKQQEKKAAADAKTEAAAQPVDSRLGRKRGAPTETVVVVATAAAAKKRASAASAPEPNLSQGRSKLPRAAKSAAATSIELSKFINAANTVQETKTITIRRQQQTKQPARAPKVIKKSGVRVPVKPAAKKPTVPVRRLSSSQQSSQTAKPKSSQEQSKPKLSQEQSKPKLSQEQPKKVASKSQAQPLRRASLRLSTGRFPPVLRR